MILDDESRISKSERIANSMGEGGVKMLVITWNENSNEAKTILNLIKKVGTALISRSMRLSRNNAIQFSCTCYRCYAPTPTQHTLHRIGNSVSRLTPFLSIIYDTMRQFFNFESDKRIKNIRRFIVSSIKWKIG